jgi:hypothetical protein
MRLMMAVLIVLSQGAFAQSGHPSLEQLLLGMTELQKKISSDDSICSGWNDKIPGQSISGHDLFMAVVKAVTLESIQNGTIVEKSPAIMQVTMISSDIDVKCKHQNWLNYQRTHAAPPTFVAPAFIMPTQPQSAVARDTQCMSEQISCRMLCPSSMFGLGDVDAARRQHNECRNGCDSTYNRCNMGQ